MNPKLLFLVPLLPLAGALVNILFGMRLPRRAVAGVAVTAVALPFLLLLGLLPLAEEGSRPVLATWLESGPLKIAFGLLFDRLAASMALMVAGVSALIHLYAAGYMEHEEDLARFFALLNLFVFAMLTIVLADNLLLLFLGWEGVGFCSYALIGFWYRKRENAEAGRKAFLVTRVGDVFLGIALLWLFSLLGTLGIPEINAAAPRLSAAALTGLTLLLLLGACGKSAQLPLMTWLADAMAGPTPVSALIHAATMVTAGVYLLCRLFPLVSLSPAGMGAIAAVGALTALYAATCALAQREIKRVLAYSTMSQVGYMFLAVGAGSAVGGMFHLLTHAFFKACLFMGAGCIIHLYNGENDLSRMGGLGRRDPLLFWSFLAAALCLAGVPLTGGFFSKDAALAAALGAGHPLYLLLLGVGLLTALLTALYTFRMVYLVFAGSPRGRVQDHPLPGVMRWTLLPLAGLGLVGGLLNLPPAFGGGQGLAHWLPETLEQVDHPSHMAEWGLAAASALAVLAGWWLARRRYREAVPGEEGFLAAFLRRGWMADRVVEVLLLVPFRFLARFFWAGIDRGVIDGLVERTGRGCLQWGEELRRFTTGRVSHYVAGFAWGLVVILGWFLLTLTWP